MYKFDIYYSALKKITVKQIYLGCTILGKVTQSQKENKPHVLPHM